MQRGMAEDEAMAMIVRGFVEPIARELPMEYALELNRLIELQMEGARWADARPVPPHPRDHRRRTRDRDASAERRRCRRDSGLAPAPDPLLRPRGPPRAHRARGGVALPPIARLRSLMDASATGDRLDWDDAMLVGVAFG